MVGGDANIAGGAGVEGKVAHAASSAPGGAGTPSTPSAPSSLRDHNETPVGFTVENDLVSKPQNLASESAGAQSGVSGESAEAAMNRTLGGQGTSVMNGGPDALGDSEISGLEDRPMAQAEYVGRVEKLEALDPQATGEDAVLGGAGAPASEIDRADQLSFNQRDQVQARVDVATTAHEDAAAAYEDPSGTARAAVQDAATGEAMSRAPVNPGQVEADVDVAMDVTQDPTAAAQSRVEVEAGAELREAARPGGTDGTGTGRNGSGGSDA